MGLKWVNHAPKHILHWSALNRENALLKQITPIDNLVTKLGRKSYGSKIFVSEGYRAN